MKFQDELNNGHGEIFKCGLLIRCENIKKTLGFIISVSGRMLGLGLVLCDMAVSFTSGGLFQGSKLLFADTFGRLIIVIVGNFRFHSHGVSRRQAAVLGPFALVRAMAFATLGQWSIARMDVFWEVGEHSDFYLVMAFTCLWRCWGVRVLSCRRLRRLHRLYRFYVSNGSYHDNSSKK